MEEEKSSIQKLKDFARNSGRRIEFLEQAYPSNALQPITYHRRSLYIPNHDNTNTYFVCYYDAKKMYGKDTYSGFFFSLSVSKPTKVLIRKKHFFDRLNLFSGNNTYKSGVASFDSQVMYEEAELFGSCKIFTNRKVQTLIEKAFQLDPRLRITINGVDVDFVPELKNHSHFGIFTTQDWFVEPEKIESLFKLVGEIQRLVVPVHEANLIDRM